MRSTLELTIYNVLIFIYKFEGTSLLPGLSLYFAEASLEFEIRLNPVREPGEPETPRRNQSSCLEESRKKLLGFVTKKIEIQRKNQQLLK